jgi:hypothetical protein
MFQVFYMFHSYVATCKCFIWMLQKLIGMLHMLQLLYTYVASLFFQTYVASVFIWMLHMFHTYVSIVLSDVVYVLQWFQVFFKCFCKCFRCMFKVFYLPSNVCYKCCIIIFQK